MKEGLTLAEREAIVQESIRLIKRPDTFIQGEWKCPIYQKPKGQELVQVPGAEIHSKRKIEAENLVPATDSQGRPLFAYCVEGAVNQAGINLLGLQRAIQLGAAKGDEKYGEPEPSHSSDFIEYLSVNEVARVMFEDLFQQMNPYGDEYGEFPEEYRSSAAQIINDDFAEYMDDHEPNKDTAHERVMRILRRRLQQLRGKS